MTDTIAPHAPPFCPNPRCDFHRLASTHWRVHRDGFFTRRRPPHRVRRYRCLHCRRHFSDQTFRVSYWLKRPDLLPRVFHRLLGCSGFRQIAREFGVSPTTVLTHAARLGRHCLLFHERERPRGPLTEPVVLDGFESFEYSQYWPTSFHVVAGARSHFFYGFTDSECRRRGRMTERQRRRRARLEALHGRPDPRSIEREVAQLFSILAPEPQALDLDSDDHRAYPRALARLPHLSLRHRITSSRRVRTPENPLFPVNLLDLLIRHGSANHKRETIAFSKRRQSAVERLAVLLVWRNYMKSFSERKRDGSPAMRLGLSSRRLELREVLGERLFPSRIRLPQRWMEYYRRTTRTRQIPLGREHRLSYAF
jgi:transposase-like protein